MAASRKAAKRNAGKKSARKKSSRGGASSRGTTKKKRPARKRARAPRGGLEAVRQVGEKTWETLKNTTAQVVEGVKETFGG